MKRRDPRFYIGIDPGASGGIAVVCDGRLVSTHHLSITLHDLWEKVSWAREMLTVDSRSVFAAIEKVHSMPGQGVRSMFSFGCSFGAQRMALVAAGIPFEEVQPQKWMGYYSMSKQKGEKDSAWKNRLKAKAQSLFPREHVTQATADAILIAWYLYRSYERR